MSARHAPTSASVVRLLLSRSTLASGSARYGIPTRTANSRSWIGRASRGAVMAPSSSDMLTLPAR